MMKLVSGLALASASLLSLAAHAAAPDPAPTLVTDAKGTALTGAHHLSGAAFSLIVTDWWLSGTIAQNQPQDVQLMVEVHLPAYPLLDRAADAAGRKLDVVILNRGPSSRWPRKASERIAVVLPADYVEKARTAGLSITVSGKDQSFPVKVPAPTIDAFFNRYLAAIASDTTPANAAPTPTPAAQRPASTPSPAPTPASPTIIPAPQSAPAPKPAAPAPAPTDRGPATSPPPAASPPLASSPPAPAPVAPPAPAAAPQATPPAPVPADDNDPAITPIQDKRVRLPNGQFMGSPPSPAPTPASSAAPDTGTSASDEGSGGGHGIWVDSLGVQFVATSSGAMVLMTRPGSIAEAKGIESGDFIEAVDGAPIKALPGDQMAAKIGAPGVKVLHMIAAGDIKVR